MGFVKHMENEHGAYFDHDFILATCMMDDDEKKAVKSVIISKYFDENTNVVVEDDIVDVKKEPTSKVRKVKNDEDKCNSSVVEKQATSLPVVSFRSEKNKSVCGD